IARNVQKLISLVLFVPLFMVFGAVVIYVFYTLGSICSVHLSESAGFVQNLMAPFTASPYAPNQLLFMGICAVVLMLIFASSTVKSFSHSTTALLFLAFVSLLAGLFTPNVPFMEMEHVFEDIFSPDYYLCYFVLALVWALSFCFTINRSFSQGILGAALVVLSLETAYLTAHLSIAPNQQDMFFTVVFYASLFCGLCTMFYLISRSAKNSSLLPAALLIAAVSGIWFYTVSGLAVSLKDTADVLVARVPVKIYSQQRKSSGTDVEKEFSAAQDRFRDIDRTNELTGLSNEEATALLSPRIDKVLPGMLDQNFKPFFAELLARYYQGGEDRIKTRVWDYALTLPIYNFNKSARENDAYFFLVAMLYLFGLLNCVGAILFKEEL
ncbi:MAG: hypothetical protein J5601_02600, partial [Elusimicrobiaceae bacterium]|nr:hypothetical protein [Elusimicrobiaceae bacterium]